MSKTRITLIEGDGIGPEITSAVVKILNAVGAELEYDHAIVGEKIYLDPKNSSSSGINNAAWEVIRRNNVMLKAPITTPTGAGYKSLNVTIRKELGLYINLRPSVSYYPIIEKSPKKMDLVIVRENEEDLYAGIEHRQTPGSYSCLKLLTRAGALKICHYAFEYAKAQGRKKITCMVKDNIMKMCDGMFYKAFQEVSKHYPEFQELTETNPKPEYIKEHYIIDIGAARIASKPESFDVIVTENLYGDIISDIASEASGSVGVAGSANLGEKFAMFEAIHGSAPRMANKNSANPTAFLNAAIMMLEHLCMTDKANRIRNALLATIEAGYHTKDLFIAGKSKGESALGTKEFADKVIEHFDKTPDILKHLGASETNTESIIAPFNPQKYWDFLMPAQNPEDKKLVGVDFFIDGQYKYGSELAKKITSLNLCGLKLSSILSRGLSIWSHNKEPRNEKEIEFCDHWMCRFIQVNLIQKEIQENIEASVSHIDVCKIFEELTEAKFDVIKMEKLYYYRCNQGFERGYSMGQGE